MTGREKAGMMVVLSDVPVVDATAGRTVVSRVYLSVVISAVMSVEMKVYL